MPLYIQSQPSKSLSDRIYTAEFDDSVIDQSFWKNPRYDGCQIKTREINKFTPKQTAPDDQTGIGFSTIIAPGIGIGLMAVGGTGNFAFTVGGPYASQPHVNHNTNAPGLFKVSGMVPNIVWEGDTANPTGLNPNITRKTTALYISNTVIGGEEDPQFATIKGHSYVNINQILLIDPETDQTQLLDKQAEDYIPFHSFITNDLPTAGSFSIRLIDEAIAHNLKGPNQYKVKMNKGFLLKSFDFNIDKGAEQLTENNSIYLYKGGTKETKYVIEGAATSVTKSNQDNRVRFKYGKIETILGGTQFTPATVIMGVTVPAVPGEGHVFAKDRIGPSFGSASIIQNKFTQQYYSGSFGRINEPSQPQGVTNQDILETSGLGSASRFIGINSLDFLVQNAQDTTLTHQEKTELHLTLFHGTKDFGSGSNDERSISTFEVDANQSVTSRGTVCHSFLPLDHELILKGNNDNRFKPKTNTFKDDFLNGHLTSSALVGGCVPIGTHAPATNAGILLQRGINVDFFDEVDTYVQGGFLGPVGYLSTITSSNTSLYGISLSGSYTVDNYYSGSDGGSFSYQLSFLDRDHTLITNLPKDAELFDGIGNKGIVIIPENTEQKIKDNINFYLEQAGIIDSFPNTTVLLSDDVR